MPIYARFDCYYSALAAARKGVVHVYAAQGGGEFRCTVAVGGGGRPWSSDPDLVHVGVGSRWLRNEVLDDPAYRDWLRESVAAEAGDRPYESPN
jgi:hypothetical protein